MRNPVYARLLRSGFIGQLCERYGESKAMAKARARYEDAVSQIASLERSGILQTEEAWRARVRNARRWHASLLRRYRRSEGPTERRTLVRFVMSGTACDRHGRALS